jgi:dihydrofolate reductase
MRKLVVSTFSTLDGVMQAPGGPEEDPTGGFTKGGWSVHYWDDMMGQVMGASMSRPFDLLLGRKTYEIFAAHWPFAGDQDPAARRLNEATKYVVSTTLRTLTWRNSRLIAGDVAAEVARLKSQDGPELQVQGSSQLIQTLLPADLIDELRLWIFPVVLGHGKRLFGKGTVPAALALADTQTSTTGVLITTYRRAGAVKTGSFALEKPTEAERERRARMAREG